MVGNGVFFRTDDAWDFLIPGERLDLPIIDVREEAKALRFITTAARINEFDSCHSADMRPFTLFGSGDFHHLSGVWLRQFHEPFTLLSFDNHPDWDIRPPKWGCGAWINRALENPMVEHVSIWGCGNFECNLPGRLLGNRKAAHEKRLLVHPWRQEKVSYPDWLCPIMTDTWKSTFGEWAESQTGRKIYVTIDLDCLTPEEAITNWEQGNFTVNDLLWALRTLRENAVIIGGDICGAWSQPAYATSFQKFAGWFDHPKLDLPDPTVREVRNRTALDRLWPALTA